MVLKDNLIVAPGPSKPPAPKPPEKAPPSQAPQAPPAPAPSRAPGAPFILPLSMKVREVRTTKLHIDVDCVVVDAEGRSVQFLPLSMDIKTTVAEVEAILQATVKQTAESVHARGAAILLPPVEMSDAPALQKLVGQVYKGSVAR